MLSKISGACFSFSFFLSFFSFQLYAAPHDVLDGDDKRRPLSVSVPSVVSSSDEVYERVKEILDSYKAHVADLRDLPDLLGMTPSEKAMSDFLLGQGAMIHMETYKNLVRQLVDFRLKKLSTGDFLDYLLGMRMREIEARSESVQRKTSTLSTRDEDLEKMAKDKGLDYYLSMDIVNNFRCLEYMAKAVYQGIGPDEKLSDRCKELLGVSTELGRFLRDEIVEPTKPDDLLGEGKDFKNYKDSAYFQDKPLEEETLSPEMESRLMGEMSRFLPGLAGFSAEQKSLTISRSQRRKQEQGLNRELRRQTREDSRKQARRKKIDEQVRKLSEQDKENSGRVETTPETPRKKGSDRTFGAQQNVQVTPKPAKVPRCTSSPEGFYETPETKPSCYTPPAPRKVKEKTRGTPSPRMVTRRSPNQDEAVVDLAKKELDFHEYEVSGRHMGVFQQIFEGAPGLRYDGVRKAFENIGIKVDDSLGSSHQRLLWTNAEGKELKGGFWHPHGTGDSFGIASTKRLKACLEKFGLTNDTVVVKKEIYSPVSKLRLPAVAEVH